MLSVLEVFEGLVILDGRKPIQKGAGLSLRACSVKDPLSGGPV